MVYLIFGMESIIIKNKVSGIKQEVNLDDLAWNYYDLENSTLKSIMEDANSGTLFSEKRGIVVDNAYIFTRTTNKKLPEQDTKLLEKYLDFINPNTILIFTINNEKIDNSKKITKKLGQVGKIIDGNVKKNSYDFIKKLFLPCSIKYDEAIYFKTKLGDDLNLLTSEALKIVTYKDEKGEVTKEDIDNLVTSNIDLDMFHLIDNIVSDKKKESLESFEEMLKHKVEPLQIIVTLASQFRIFYQTKILFSKGYSEAEIADFLKVHPFRVKKSLERRRQFSNEELLNYIERLADLDYQIKSGNIDKVLGMELFILNKNLGF